MPLSDRRDRGTIIVEPRGRKPLPNPPPIVPVPSWPAQRIRGRSTQRTSTPQSSRQISFNAAQGAIPIGYGYLKTGIQFVLRPKVVSSFLYTAGVVAEGEIDSYVSTRVDGRLVSELTGATVTAYTGTSGQTTNAMLTGIEPLWTNALANLSYLAIKLPIPNQQTGEYDMTRFEVVWKGKKVYDPRSALTVWSDNPALIWADLATNQRYGGRLASGKIDWDSIGAAADDCDEVVASGPAAPGSAPTAARSAGTGNFLYSPSYTWTYTNVDVNGYESAESPSVGLIVGDGDSVNLAGISVGPGGTTKRRIYRTRKDGLTPRRLVDTINDNTTTTYNDAFADERLGGFPNPGPYKRYTLDLLVSQPAPWPDWDQTIRAHFACLRIYSNGKHKLIVDKAKSVSGVTFSDQGANRNLVGFPQLRSKGTRERPGVVVASYIDRFNDYSPGSVREPDPEPDGTKVEERFEFQGIPGHQAVRLAKYHYNLRLRDREYTMRTMQRGALPLPGAIVEVTSVRGPLTAEKMLLLNSEPDGIAWKHQLENYAAGVYSDTVVTDVPPVVTPPPDPLATPPNVTGLTAPTDTEAKIGTVYWTPAASPTVIGYEVYDNRTSPPTFIRFVPSQSNPTVDNALDLKLYVTTFPNGSRYFNIKVVSVSAAGRRSSGALVDWTLGGITDPGTDSHDGVFYATYAASVTVTDADWNAAHDALTGTLTAPDLIVATWGKPSDTDTITRAFFEFQIALPADSTIQSARLQFVSTVPPPFGDMTVHVVASTAGDGPIDATDYDQVGTDSFGSTFVYSVPNEYRTVELDAGGVATIPLSGKVKFALIAANDFTDTEPNAIAESLGTTTLDPTIGGPNGVRLVVTYTSGGRDLEEDQLPLDWEVPLVETPDGIIDTFTIPSGVPLDGGHLHRNVVNLIEGMHYERTDDVITFLADYIPITGDSVRWSGQRPRT